MGTDDESFSNVCALPEQAHAKQQTSQQYSSNYSPEVETEEPFQKKCKENDLDGRSFVYFDETAIVESLIDKSLWFENLRMLT